MTLRCLLRLRARVFECTCARALRAVAGVVPVGCCRRRCCRRGRRDRGRRRGRRRGRDRDRGRDDTAVAAVAAAAVRLLDSVRTPAACAKKKKKKKERNKKEKKIETITVRRGSLHHPVTPPSRLIPPLPRQTHTHCHLRRRSRHSPPPPPTYRPTRSPRSRAQLYVRAHPSDGGCQRRLRW